MVGGFTPHFLTSEAHIFVACCSAVSKSTKNSRTTRRAFSWPRTSLGVGLTSNVSTLSSTTISRNLALTRRSVLRLRRVARPAINTFTVWAAPAESRREKWVDDRWGRRGLGSGARGGVAARRVLVGAAAVVRVRSCDSSLLRPALLPPERRIGANPPSTRTAVWYVFALCTLCLRICVLYAHARTKNVSPVHACVYIWACGRAIQMSLGSPTSLWQQLH